MIRISIQRSDARCWCPLCGTLSCTSEGEINECEHFEGMLSLGEFVMGDKNGIVEEAYEKDRELVDIQDEGTDEEYAEACKKYNVTPDVNGRVFTIDILESKLNDKYVCFDISAPMPSCAEEFYLYNFS